MVIWTVIVVIWTLRQDCLVDARDKGLVSPGLPASGAPFLEVRLLLAKGRVVTVTRVEPGVVRELVEDAGLHVVEQGREVLRGRGPADATREQ